MTNINYTYDVRPKRQLFDISVMTVFRTGHGFYIKLSNDTVYDIIEKRVCSFDTFKEVQILDANINIGIIEESK